MIAARLSSACRKCIIALVASRYGSPGSLGLVGAVIQAYDASNAGLLQDGSLCAALATSDLLMLSLGVALLVTV